MTETIPLLYVDDEPALLDIGKIYLERGGEFSVDVIPSAGEALDLLKRKDYDAIISDYQMPGMDGIAFLKQVRHAGNTIPFILFTGRGREEIVIQALNEGADFYLQKGGEPCSQFAELSHTVRHAVQRRRAEEGIRCHERREADILNFLPDATFAIDTAGTVIAWNQAMEEMTGTRAEEILGKNDFAYTHALLGERRPMLIDLILAADEEYEKARYLSTRRDNRTLTAEFAFTKPDGNVVYLWGKAARLLDPAGTITGAIESIRDITESRKAETNLKSAYGQLSAAEEELRSQYDELAQSERQHREDEENFRALVESAPDPIYIAVGERFAYVNPAMALLMGASSPGDLTGMPVYERIHPRSHEKIRRRLQTATCTGGSVGLNETVYLKTDGTPVEVESAVSSCTHQGKPACLVILRNITHRKASERLLRESRERFREQYRNNPLAIFTWQHRRGDFILVAYNKAADKLTEGRVKEFLGKRASHLYADRPEVLTAMNRCFSARTTNVREDVSRHFLPGRCIRATSTFISPDLVMAHVEDITDKKAAEETIAGYRRMLDTLMENLPGMVYRCRNDPEWTMEFASGGSTGLCGYEPRELVDNRVRSFGSLIVPEDRELVRDLVREAIERHQPFQIEYRIIDKAGQVRWVWEQGRGMFDPADHIVALEGYIADVSDRRQAEEALWKANRTLTLLHGLTRHDINNQVQALEGYAAILQGKSPDPALEGYITRILDTADRIAAMIQFAADYEAIGVSEPVWQDLRTAVDAAVRQAALGDVTVRNAIPEGAGVLADPLITRVFYNLVENAVREGGKITQVWFTLEERDGSRIIVCADDGIGIPPKDKEKIFTRGFGKNTGLGLFFSREILSMTGISIAETGTFGKGARFEMAVPRGAFRFTGLDPAPDPGT
jgi:PAS domain S-box-containing protein